MFRRGGSTSGITTGLRQGYDKGNMVQGAKDYMNLVETLAPSRGIGAGNEFLMNLGLNLVSNPPSGNILQTLGTEAKGPFQQFQKTKRAEGAGKRDLVIAYLNTLEDDERVTLQKQIDYLVEDFGISAKEALDRLKPRWRKDQSAEETAREQLDLLVEDLTTDPDTKMKRWDRLTALDIAKAWQDRPEKDSEGKPYDYDTQLIAIDEEDVKNGDIDIETGVITISEPTETYTDGTTYYDYKRKKWYTHQNGQFLPVNPS